MNIEFDHNYQQKVMFQSFTEKTTLAGPKDVQAWRSAWMSALASWHSPYKAVVDLRNLQIDRNDGEIVEELERMVKFFKGFFLRDIVGFTDQAANQGTTEWPFKVFTNESEATQAVGLRKARAQRHPGDFRDSIQIQNHFRQHTVEMNFSDPVTLNSKEKLHAMRSKLSNNLMQWHSKWNLLIDCANLEWDEALNQDFASLEKFFHGLFLKKVVGYSPKSPPKHYPFEVFRSRHRAAALLEAEGAFSGDEADCKSRK